jgi:hypothetical protein
MVIVAQDNKFGNEAGDFKFGAISGRSKVRNGLKKRINNTETFSKLNFPKTFLFIKINQQVRHKEINPI